jgi:ABC-type uncharacterized transport system permease subunit
MSRLFALAAPRSQVETANSAPEFAMHSGQSPMAHFALGIGTLHSTTGLRIDYLVGLKSFPLFA